MYINSYGQVVSDDYLAHYGKPERSGRYPWGSGGRPYQRLEGSGRDHASVSEKKRLSKGGSSPPKRKKRGAIRTTASVIKKGLIKINKYPAILMSDQELNDRIERLKLEDQLRMAMGKKPKNKQLLKQIRSEEKTRGQKLVSSSLDSIGTKVVAPLATGVASYAIKSALARGLPGTHTVDAFEEITRGINSGGGKKGNGGGNGGGNRH